MTSTSTLKFYVNGKLREISNPRTNTSLLEYLRCSGLTGAKLACGEGACGACTVLVSRWTGEKVERITVTSCSLLLCSLHGTEVTTVEGLGSTKTSDSIHPIQERLYACHGSQCGFCSPGMVMSMAGMLCQSTTPDMEDLLHGLQGNLCRCTGYRPILEAFSTFTKDGMQGSDQPEDKEAIEVATYDSSTFKEFNPDSLVVDEDRIEFMREALKETLRFGDHEKDGPLWLRPTSLAEALAQASEMTDCAYRLGGTGSYSIYPPPSPPAALIDLTGLPELKGLRLEEGLASIGAGETFASVVHHMEQEASFTASDTGKTLRILLRILKNLATPQLRNTASLGGTILWGHPASDILPLLRVSGARLAVVTAGLQQKTVEVDSQFDPKGSVGKGDIITQVQIPFTNEKHVVFFDKQARRKTADLAVANIAIAAEWNLGRLTSVKASLGGVGAALKECDDKAVAQAEHLATLLMKSNPFELTKKMIQEALEQDLGHPVSQYRVAIFTSLVQKFIDSLNHEKRMVRSRPTIRAHQLFEKVSESLPEIDPVTRPIAHVSSAVQCTGEARFLDDIPSDPHELHLYPVQSTEPHANFTIKNVAKALGVPGVVAWISHEDIAPERNLWSVGDVPDEEVLPINEVLHYGQIIGLIAAETREAAKSAAAMVEISYRKLEAILTLDQAVAAGDRTILGATFAIDRHQDQAPSAEELVAVSGSISAAGQEHFYMEPHSALAIPSGEKQELTIHFTSQEPSSVQAIVASVLGLPQNRITVKCKRTGGAFGGKEKSLVAILAAVAASKTGQSCRLVLPRKIDIEITGHRHEIQSAYRCDVTKEGRIVDVRIDSDYNAGFSNDLSGSWGLVLSTRFDGGYTLRNVSTRATPRRTNLASNTAFRGFGGPEGTLIVEDMIERIADLLKLDPAAVRRQNITRMGDLLHYGSSTVGDDNVLRCFEECLTMSNYEEQRKSIVAFNADPANGHRRRGIAIIPTKFAPSVPFKSFNQGSAFVRIFKDGTVLLSHGGIEMGQGLHTKMLQVCARVLGVGMEKIYLNDTSTETIPNASPTGGSTGTDINGHAVRMACEKLKARLDIVQAEHPHIKTWEALVLKANMERVQLAEYGFYNTSMLEYDVATNNGEVFNYLTGGAGCVVVEVDCLTGNHTLLRADIVMDVGQSINPAIDIGQIEGAFVQGYGYVSMEEMLHSRQGEILTNNLSTYKLPTVADIPREFNVRLLRNSRNHKEACFSAKGIGEPPLSLCGAVVAALRQAVASYRSSQSLDPWFQMRIPFTTERIFRACHGLPEQEPGPWITVV